MDISTIDYWANNRTSGVHRASAPAKLLAAGLVIAAVVASDDFILLLSIYLALVAVIATTRLPLRQVLLIGAYPAIFALIFAISRWDGNPVDAAVVVLKAMDAALAMLMVITTTPYPAVFAVFHRFLPGRIGDALFLTYRSIFILLAAASELWMALRLRGGLRSGRHRQNVRNLASGLGLLLLRAVDLSEELYAMMRVRGYRGRLADSRVWQSPSWNDLLPIAVGSLVLLLALALRFFPGTVRGYNGYFLVAALAGLLVGLLLARRPSRARVEATLGRDS